MLLNPFQAFRGFEYIKNELASPIARHPSGKSRTLPLKWKGPTMVDSLEDLKWLSIMLANANDPVDVFEYGRIGMSHLAGPALTKIPVW